MIGRTYLTASLSYYNTLAGRWEPAVEQVNMNFELTKGKVQTKVCLKFEKEININCTEIFLQTLNSAGRSMNKVLSLPVTQSGQDSYLSRGL